MKPHEHMAGFGTRNGELRVGGMPLSRLAARVGSTPFFAYDRGLLDQRVDRLRAALPDRVELSFAMKANPMPAIVQHLARRLDRIDIASGLELQTALDTTIPADKVSFAGPGKTPAEIRQAVAAGILIEVESSTEFRRVIAAGDELGLVPNVAVRVNPDFAVKGSGMRMGGGPQQFGIDAEQVPAVLREYANAGVNVLGFHVFAGSQNLNAEIIAEAQRRTVDLVSGLAEHLPSPVHYLNLGGGFGIPYVEKDRPLDLDAVAANLHQLVDGPITERMPEASPVIELGRYLVGECGVYVTRVVDLKVSRGKTFLVVDGGMHHQLAASGNFGQAIRRNYPVMVGNRAELASEEVVTVVGCLCTPLDLLANDVELPPAEIDDLIVIFQAGAYGQPNRIPRTPRPGGNLRLTVLATEWSNHDRHPECPPGRTDRNPRAAPKPRGTTGGHGVVRRVAGTRLVRRGEPGGLHRGTLRHHRRRRRVRRRDLRDGGHPERVRRCQTRRGLAATGRAARAPPARFPDSSRSNGTLRRRTGRSGPRTAWRRLSPAPRNLRRGE